MEGAHPVAAEGVEGGHAPGAAVHGVEGVVGGQPHVGGRGHEAEHVEAVGAAEPLGLAAAARGAVYAVDALGGGRQETSGRGGVLHHLGGDGQYGALGVAHGGEAAVRGVDVEDGVHVGHPKAPAGVAEQVVAPLEQVGWHDESRAGALREVETPDAVAVAHGVETVAASVVAEAHDVLAGQGPGHVGCLQASVGERLQSAAPYSGPHAPRAVHGHALGEQRLVVGAQRGVAAIGGYAEEAAAVGAGQQVAVGVLGEGGDARGVAHHVPGVGCGGVVGREGQVVEGGAGAWQHQQSALVEGHEEVAVGVLLDVVHLGVLHVGVG